MYFLFIGSKYAVPKGSLKLIKGLSLVMKTSLWKLLMFLLGYDTCKKLVVNLFGV